jgi:hypothetical protein
MILTMSLALIMLACAHTVEEAACRIFHNHGVVGLSWAGGAMKKAY